MLKPSTRSLLLLYTAIWLPVLAIAQGAAIDSIYIKLRAEKKDTSRVLLLNDLSFQYQRYKPDSALLLSQEAYHLALQHHFLRGESWALASMADAFHTLANYPKAVEYYIRQLKIEEKRNIPDNIASVYNNMASIYNTERDEEKALYYGRLADSIVRHFKLTDMAMFTSLNLGDIFEKANSLDSALVYTVRCYILSKEHHNDLIMGTALNNLGNIYLKKGNYSSSLDKYRESTPYLMNAKDYNTLAECNLGMATVFLNEGIMDSAYQYAVRVFDLATDNQFLKRAAEASVLLVRLFKRRNQVDSAFKYEEIMVQLRDSIDNKERIRKLQAITIDEQLRQKELAEIKRRDAEERVQKLEFLSIGLAIPVFFFISLFLSRRKVHPRIIRFSGIISLLMLFEYITLLTHPLISETTHHSPILEIIVFVCIALVLTPAHHRIEHWLLSRLTRIHDQHLHKQAKAVQKEIP